MTEEEEELKKWALKFDSDKKSRRLANRLKEVEGLYRQAQKDNEELEQALDFALAIKDCKPIKIKPKAKSANEAVAVAVLSDWHLEERVDPSTVNGCNEFTPDIAEIRVIKAFENIRILIDKERSLAKIDTLVLAVIGDLITGYIHDELVESNWLSPTEATMMAQRLLIGGIEMLLNDSKLKKIYVPCCYGNHGRTTTKRRVSTAARNSYEWMMYHQTAHYFKNNNRVQFDITDGIHVYTEVLGYTLRFHHGDNIRYQGGVGGITIPFNKAIHAWNNQRRADYDIMGHYHQLQFTPHGVVNGSLIGYNAFALSIKASAEPPQQAMFLVAKDYGPTCFNRVFVS
jgi:hypothetical protein